MNNDKRKSEYLNRVFKASKGEIEEILRVGFQPHGCWITLFKDDKIIQVPSYLLAQLKDFILEGETVKPHSTETNIREELETLYNGCEKIFISAGDIIKDYLESDYKRILESDNTLEKKIERMDSLIEKSTHLIGCYGQLSDAPGYNTGGLIFGSSVDEVLSVIDEPISRSLNNLQPMSYYSSNQSTLSLKKLTDIQKLALPKAKQYISLQISDDRIDSLSPIEKIQLVEKVRKREGVNNYDQAINLIEAETGERPFIDYNSFKSVRHRLREHL